MARDHTTSSAGRPERATSVDTGRRVDISGARIAKMKNQHTIGFDALVRAIEWADGKPNRGRLVTAYPVQTHAGAPQKKDGTSWAPAWLSDSFALGPVNNDILDS